MLIMDLKKTKAVIKLLKKKKLRISFAESCTGGLLSSSIASISGSSNVFDMGLVTYSNKAKNKILKISNQIIKKYGSVSEQCCLAMVDNLSKLSKSQICVSITGIAGPNGGTKQKPIGLVFIGIKINKKIKINKYKFKYKKRTSIQNISVQKALSLILREIN